MLRLETDNNGLRSCAAAQLRSRAVGHRLDAADEAALLDKQLALDGGWKGLGHGCRVNQTDRMFMGNPIQLLFVNVLETRTFHLQHESLA